MAHRGRIQAQGAGTEKSESWCAMSPPTESEMLEMCDELESQLSRSERSDRASPMAALRNYIRAAAQAGGIHAPTSKTFFGFAGRSDRY